MKLKKYFKYPTIMQKSILLVDDEGDLGWIMKKVIKDAGHKFSYATTAKEAIKKIKSLKNLNIALVDLRIADKNGLTFIKTAKAINDKIKFIVISAFGTPNIKLKARRLGVRYFLDKPIRADRLLDIINKDGL